MYLERSCINRHTDTTHLLTFGVFLADSSLSSEDSSPGKKGGSLYLDLGALAGYYHLVRPPPSAEYN